MAIQTALSSRFCGRARHQEVRSLLSWTLGMLLLLPLALAACSDTPPPPDGTVLNQLHWCAKETLLFQDASKSPPATLTDWGQVKSALDFTVYLPQRLPTGSCLVSGEAIIHDKVLGSSFGVSYVLPDGGTLAFSETAVSGQQTPTFQCSPSGGTPTNTPTPTPKGTPTPTPGAGTGTTLLCLGSKAKTNIVMNSSQPQKELQAIFDSLQANVDWIPQG